MTSDKQFALVWQKVEQAKKHIRDLDAAIAAFHATAPYKVASKRDQNRRPIYFVSQIDDVPIEVTLILGDAIQCLRTALDHLAQQLYLVGTGSSNLARHTSFPISDTASEHKSLVNRRVKGMTQEAIDAICTLEPYKDGKGHQFWVLNSLNNIDKHRTLVACAGSFQSVDIVPVIASTFPPERREAFAKLSLFLKPADKLCPLKVGDELFIGSPDAEFNPTARFELDVALNEPEVIHPGLMRDAVQQFADLVSDTPFLV